MVAKTLSGLEGVLAAELLTLGAKEVEQQTRAVSFVGDKGFNVQSELLPTHSLTNNKTY